MILASGTEDSIGNNQCNQAQHSHEKSLDNATKGVANGRGVVLKQRLGFLER